jgi:hypothetical protein
VTEPTPPEHSPVAIQVPDALEGGVYSNLVAVWHTPYEFTLDFAVILPPQVATRADGGQPITVTPARVVSRVKVPPAAVFELMRALSQNERLYEQNIGAIPRPGRPDADPPLYRRTLRPILG